MNVQDYIASGAIEACVMGFGTEQDWQELLRMASLYPDVKAEKERLEQFVERKHLQLIVPPPAALKEKIFSQLEFNTTPEEAPVVDLPVADASTKHADDRPKVVPIVPTPKPVKWLQRALAVSAILLMGSVLLNFYFFSKYFTSQEQFEALLLEKNSMLAKYEAVETSFSKMKDPSMKPVIMKATAARTGSMATVYWDEKSKDVYLLVNSLPKPASNKQYQLWAIVDGKPVDAGMVTELADSLLVKMKNIPNAQAFAITLENEGGSPTPTMDAMYVMGEI